MDSECATDLKGNLVDARPPCGVRFKGLAQREGRENGDMRELDCGSGEHGA